MIRVELEDMGEQIEDLLGSFAKLPRHIAKKHMQAAMKRTMKDSIPALKRNTPRAKSYIRIRRDGTAFRIAGGSLRRAVAVKSKYVQKPGHGIVYGVLGYKNVTFNQQGYGESISQSRKAIWLENGTKRGVKPHYMVAMTVGQIGGPSADRLASEMAKALEKAAAEVASGKNKGRAT